MRLVATKQLFVSLATLLLFTNPASADLIQFTSFIDGAQSIAMPSIGDRNGTGSATLTLDTDTGILAFDISFEGLIADDIGGLAGAGLLVAHFHVGDRTTNGPIPVGLFDGSAGLAPGVMGTDMLGATSGRFFGSIDIFGLADQNGLLRNNVLAQDFFDAFLTDPGQDANVYINIHSFNNPAGEIRGQVVRVNEVAEPAGLALLGLALLGLARRRA